MLLENICGVVSLFGLCSSLDFLVMFHWTIPTRSGERTQLVESIVLLSPALLLTLTVWGENKRVVNVFMRAKSLGSAFARIVGRR
jgi:hypothetical protein